MIAAKHPECGANGEQFTAIDGYYPEPTSDGSLYVLVSCGSKTFLARSTDEGSTFPIVHTGAGPVAVDAPADSVTTLGSGPQLRIGADDTFYLAVPQQVGGKVAKLLVRTSSDRGLTWSAPKDATAPRVTAILRWAVAVHGTGQLAFAYLGQKNGQTTWDAYITATRDFGAAGGPVFLSVVPNTQPLLYADDIKGAGFIALGQGQIQVPYPFPLGIQSAGVAAGNDFLGVTFGPDGSVWGSFNQDCGATPQSPGCVSTNDQTRGFVGRLVWTEAAQPNAQPSSHTTAVAPAGAAGSGGLPATGGPATLPVLGIVACALAFAVRKSNRG